MNRVFTFRQKVLFKHCDPAGIVFYPRYFEMMNDCTEAFFEDALNTPWAILHAHAMLPTVAIETVFTAPSRHGDVLHIKLEVTRIGKTSLALRTTAFCDEEVRFTTNSTLVNVDTRGLPQHWSDTLRTALTQYLGDTS